jgi:KDO2-lipid IV(A) lauroyltransferase
LPAFLQFKLGHFLGQLLYLFPSKLKHITVINITHCFPELTPQERLQLIKKNFSAIGISLIETGMAWWSSDKKLQNHFEFHGLEHVENALAKGKGLILFGPHFLSLEMVGRLVGKKLSYAVMYRPHKKKFISFILERFRKPHYAHYIPRHRFRQVLRTLQQNIPLWYAYDVDGGRKRSVFAPFFGIPTASLTTLSRLAHLSGAAIIHIGFYRRDNQFNYDIVFSPPVENFPSHDPVADATRLNALLEKAIRDKPEQYVWQYKRFKTRPLGEKRFYS